MCIDVFRFGQRLDIELLVEQIWFSVNKDNPGELDITEVYDVLIKNPKGSPECKEVWALFPHSCFKNGSFQITALPVLPPPGAAANDPYEQYNWPFGGYPRIETKHDDLTNEDRQFVVRNVADDSPEIHNSGKKELAGIALRVAGRFSEHLPGTRQKT